MKNNIQIIRGTTPTISIIFDLVDVSLIKNAALVIKQCEIPVIEIGMNRMAVDKEKKVISFTLTQKETLLLQDYKMAVISCDWLLYDGTRGRSEEVAFRVGMPAKEGVLGKYKDIHYEGDYVFKPSTEEQVIECEGLLMSENVLIKAIENQELTVKSTGELQEYEPDAEYDGFSKVIVEAIDLQEKTAKPTTSTQEVTYDNGYSGLSKVNIEAVSLQNKIATPTGQTQTIEPDEGYDGLSSVIVGAIATQTKEVKSTGQTQTITPDEGYDGISEITVRPVLTQEKTITPTLEPQFVGPDDGYDALSFVMVDADPEIQFKYLADGNQGEHNLDFKDIESIRNFADYSNASTKEVEGDGVLTVGESAFEYCSGLETVNFQNCETVKKKAFKSCSSLRTFYGLTQATSRYSRLTSIGNSAFYDCPLLEVEELNCTAIDSYAFSKCTAIENLVFKKSVRFTNGVNNFSACSNLKSITFEDSVTFASANAGTGAFIDCNNLETVRFKNTVTSAQYVFYNLPKLKTVYFEKRSGVINANFFAGCTAITDIYVPWAQGEMINLGAPWGATNAQIHYNTTYDSNGNPL